MVQSCFDLGGGGGSALFHLKMTENEEKLCFQTLKNKWTGQ